MIRWDRYDFDAREARDADTLRQLLSERGDLCYDRDRSPDLHVTASAFIVDRDVTRVLFAHHRIYDSYGWLGGHTDGQCDLQAVSLREAVEECGITPIAWTCEPIGIEVLDVPAHSRRGVQVAAHRHANVTYAWIADPAQPLRVNESEHVCAAWLEIDRLESYVREAHMMPIYRKLIARCRRIAEQKRDALAQVPALAVDWYERHHRDLPWRKTRDPYRIWVSEVLLQQTRVQAVLPAYERLIHRLPDVHALAQCDPDVLMKLWEGMGYYSRARNLQRAAIEIETKHGGIFPRTYDEIRALPGIGDYTAGAIASIAFGLPTPAVDGNVLRVVSRVCERYDSIDDLRVRKDVTARLAAIYPHEGAGQLTQSLMELGATVCVPNGAPHCAECPLAGICIARKRNAVDRLPIRAPKRDKRVETYTVAVLTRADGKIAVRRRPPSGLLAGQFELMHWDGDLDESGLARALAASGVDEYRLSQRKHATHIFTHIRWEMTCYVLYGEQLPDGAEWADADAIALPTAFRICLPVATDD